MGGLETGVLSDCQPLLTVRDAVLRFGGISALDGVNLQVQRGEICGLIGPNGAGKTSLFNCITRLYSLTSGTVRFAGESIDRVQARQVIGLGIARTFQNLGLYSGLSVLDNVLLGAHYRTKNRFLGTLFNPTGTAREERRLREEGKQALEALQLAHLADTPVSALPYGTLKRVEIARALAARPRLLLLDEPAGGLTHGEVAEFGRTLTSIRSAFDLTIVLIEHHMGLVSAICSRVVALHLGRNLADGNAHEVQSHPAVSEAYMGAKP